MIAGFLRFLTVIAAFAVVLSAATLYRVKTETRAAINDIKRLERQGAEIERRIEALEIEWAYLNSPGYLAELVGRHANALRLEERVPDNFARLIEIPPRGALEPIDESAQ